MFQNILKQTISMAVTFSHCTSQLRKCWDLRAAVMGSSCLVRLPWATTLCIHVVGASVLELLEEQLEWSLCASSEKCSAQASDSTGLMTMVVMAW